MTWKDLLTLPVNAVFYEVDLPTCPLFVKVGDCSSIYKDKDIRVIALHSDDSPSRLGIYEMDDCDRNSRRWHWLNADEVNTVIGRMMLAVSDPTAPVKQGE